MLDKCNAFAMAVDAIWQSEKLHVSCLHFPFFESFLNLNFLLFFLTGDEKRNKTESHNQWPLSSCCQHLHFFLICEGKKNTFGMNVKEDTMHPRLQCPNLPIIGYA